MKKLLLLVIFVGSALHASAQSGSLQSGSSIETMPYKIEALQHDFDFMQCDYELFKLQADLRDLSANLTISANNVTISAYHTKYDYRMYNTLIENYKSSRTLFESLKEKAESVKSFVYLKMEVANFSGMETNVLNSSLGVIDNAIDRAEKALQYYDVTIQLYRSKR